MKIVNFLFYVIVILLHCCSELFSQEPEILGKRTLNNLQHPQWGCITSEILANKNQGQVIQKSVSLPDLAAHRQNSSFNKGDRALFFARTQGLSGNYSGIYDTVRAELIGVGTKVLIWAAISEISNNHIDTNIIPNVMIDALENRTPSSSKDSSLGICELENVYFGDFPNFGNSDNLVTFLLFDIRDGGAGVGGYFNFNDQTTNDFSNQRDMLYLEAPMFHDFMADLSTPLAVTAHEIQHLINYKYSSSTTAFTNEGLSDLAAELCGYGITGPPSYYLQNTNVSLFDWSFATHNYSRAALWHVYLFQQAGDSIAKRIVQGLGTQWSRYDNALASIGHPKNGIEMWKDFATANYVLDTATAPGNIYGYKRALNAWWMKLWPPIPSGDYYDPNQSAHELIIQPYANVYIRYAAGDSLNFFVSNTAGLSVRAIQLGDQTLVSPVNLGEETLYPQFGNEAKEMCFVLTNTIGGAIACSFSSSGKKDGVVQKIAYDEGFSPEDYTFFFKRSTGAVRFSLPLDSMKLVGARFWLFDSSPFELYVYQNNGGIPGNLLLSKKGYPRKTGYCEVDLDSLDLRLHGDIFIGCKTRIEVQPGDTSTNSLHFDRTTPHHNRSYFHDGVAWKTIDQLGYGPGDLGIQAVVSSLDKTAPELTLGVLASPVVNVIRIGVGANETVSQIDLKINSVSKPLTANGDLSFASYTLQNEGMLVFSVTAVDQSQNHGMLERSYQVAPLSKSAKRISNYEVSSDQSGFVVWKESSSKDVPLNWVPLSEPVEIIATNPIKQIQIDALYNGEPILDESKIGFYTYQNDHWEYVGGNGKNGKVSATIHSGKIAVFYNPDHESIPKEFALENNYPNPFNPMTTIRYAVPAGSKVTLKVYNILGQEVRSLVNGFKDMGRYEVMWDGRNNSGNQVSSGVYLYRMEAGKFIETKKMLFVK